MNGWFGSLVADYAPYSSQRFIFHQNSSIQGLSIMKVPQNLFSLYWYQPPLPFTLFRCPFSVQLMYLQIWFVSYLICLLFLFIFMMQELPPTMVLTSYSQLLIVTRLLYIFSSGKSVPLWTRLIQVLSSIK